MSEHFYRLGSGKTPYLLPCSHCELLTSPPKTKTIVNHLPASLSRHPPGEPSAHNPPAWIKPSV